MIVNNIKKQIGSRIILDDVSFVVNESDKIGLVGINGAGKSTLLKILSGELESDFGSVKLNGETISYLKQEIPVQYNDLSIISYIKKETGIDKLEERLHDLENNLTDENMEEYGEVLNEYLSLDGYLFEENLKSILNGLDLNKDIGVKIKTLSGGEKIKVLLAVILLQNTDILLLDEPTNNLDINAIEWLEEKLKSSNKKMIIISHDEVFLNNIVNKIYELKDGKISEYNLSYKEYLEYKEQEYKRLKEEYLKAQSQKSKLKKQIQKAKEWSNKGTSKKAFNDNDKIANNYAQERTNSKNVSKLNKELQELEIPDFEEKSPINVFFNFSDTKGNKDILLQHLICGYNSFRTPEFNLSIPFGSKVNIIGSNGSGKTTLIRTILGQITPIEGEIKIGNDVRMGYISQNTLSDELNDSIYTYITSGKENIDRSKVFILLDKFNIDYEDKDKPYKTLSPGERTRVNLAKLALDNINVIILDEVTNHLDKEALDLIYELIREYNGTIISISHNRKYNEILDADTQLDVKTGEIKQKSLKRK